MAEHKIEDTNAPLARRAVRPFVGPLGPAAPARPLIRPAGPALRPTGPAGRPSPAPFASPLAAPRTALGTTASAQPAAPAADGDARDAGGATMSEPVAPAEPTAEPSELPSREPQSRRPVTSEMVALDTFAAFDAVWGGSTTPAASPVVEPVTSPVDEASLGSGAGAHGLWTEDITAADLDAMHAVMAGATDIPADQPDEAVDVRVSHGLLVSAVLDRLAERVRGGEIDVSSVAPEAPDAAVLASVLAALLGGSSSR